MGHAQALSESVSSQHQRGGSLAVVSRGGVPAKAKLVLGFSQCIAFIPITFRHPRPKALIWISHLLYMMSVDFVHVYNACKLHTSFYTRFVFQILFLPMMFVTTWVQRARERLQAGPQCCKRRAALFTRERSNSFLRDSFLTAYFTPRFNAIFRVLKCAKIQDKWYRGAVF